MSDVLTTMIKSNRILSKDLEALINTLGKRGLKREVEVGSAIHNSVTMLIDSPEKRGATT